LLDGLSRKASQSAAVHSIIVDSLDASESRTRVIAAGAAGRTKAPNALSKIVNELQSGSEQTRVDFARALAAYGVSAKPYLKVLEAVAASEIRPAQWKELEAAVATVRDSRN
jgi:hypothetical protein